MSAFLRRRSIRRAIFGELSPGALKRLRRHIGGCASCRAAYDRLALVAGDAAAARRERARLEAALPGGGGARARRPRWPLLAPLAAVPALAAAALLLVARPAPPPPPAPAVVERGGPAPDAAMEPRLALALYAVRPGARDAGAGPRLRLLGQLPASGEAFASRRDWLQLGYRGPTVPGHLVVAGRDEGGRVHVYFPAPGGSARVAAAPGEVQPLGGPIELAAGHRPGAVRLVAIFARAPLDPARIAAALAAAPRDAGLDAAGAVPAGLSAVTIGGILQIDP